MAKIPFALRALLFFINLKPLDTSIPLNKSRPMVNKFMGLLDRLFGLRTPHFYSITDGAFQSIYGHEIKLKIFTPVKYDSPLPVWVYFHGGGFAHGAYDARLNFPKAIAVRGNCIVVSVEYRLSPEHPFPAAIDDCYEATLWISRNAASFGGDGTRLAVGGESAGGTLAGTVAIMARDKGAPKLVYQTLLYPATDGEHNYPSMTENANGYMLTKALVEQYGNAYMAAPELLNEYAKLEGHNLQHLPPALVITCGYDPLRDEGNRYAQELKNAGVSVRHKCYDNMVHDFVVMMPRFLPEAREATDMIGEELKKAFKQ
jgi:acetyl esterase